MAGWKTLASIVVTLAAGQTGAAQTVELAETPKAGDCFEIHLAMTLTGEMRVTRDDKPAPLKMAATATHDYPERVLAVGPNGVIQKTARVYGAAQAEITVGGERSRRNLRAGRRLMVAQPAHGRTLVYCPAGPLTREELDLVNEHFDTLAVTGLLPGRSVKVGETWKVANEAAQALCNFEGLTSQDLECKLEEVEDQDARVSFAGKAEGIDLGAMVKLTIHGTYHYDLGARRLVSLEWRQKDERDQGPASPATIVDTTTTLKRAAIAQPASLSDIALISVPDGLELPPTLTQLTFHNEAKTAYDLVYDRDWQLVGQTKDHVILRLMDRGDFVAQLTITPWEPARPGDHLTPDAFREAMAKAPGWEQGDVVQDGVVPSEKDRWIYRVSAPGQLDGIKAVQNFYLVASPDGRQVVLAFTMTPAQAERLGSRDLALVQGLAFPAK